MVWEANYCTCSLDSAYFIFRMHVFRTCFRTKKAVSLYSEKIVEAGGPLVLDIFCDSGNIEMYTWDKDGVKFEMTKRVRGTESEEILSQKLNISILT